MSLLRTIMVAAAPLALAAGFTSCLDEASDEDKFSILVQGYVIQDYDSDTTVIYKPYLTVCSTSSDYPLAGASLYGTNGALTLTKATDLLYENNPDDYATTDLSKINGSYTATATTTTGLSKTTTFTIAIATTEQLGKVKPTELKYDGENVTVAMPYVKNSSRYGVTILPYESGNTPKRIDTYYKVSTHTSMGIDSVVTYTISFPRTSLGSDSAVIRAHVTGSTGLFQESDTCLLISK